jgi:hypothetical protein
MENICNIYNDLFDGSENEDIDVELIDYDCELENIFVENDEQGNGEPIAKKRCTTFRELCRFENEGEFGEWIKNSIWTK